MLFAKRVFFFAGIIGLLMLVPQYFLESKIGQDYPPAINHPEFFYGFIGVASAWQLAFLVIASDPVKYRTLMLAAMVEKLSFGGAVFPLYFLGRISATIFVCGLLDLVWLTLFAISYFKLAGISPSNPAEETRH